SLRLVHTESNNADTWGAVTGIAFRRPLNDQWTVVPAASIGYVDSGSGATEVRGSIYATNVASIYKWRAGRYDVAIANQI
ncbi:hypothetical protein ABTE60_21830, partial [Acinetobacter baumannii]